MAFDAVIDKNYAPGLELLQEVAHSLGHLGESVRGSGADVLV